MCHERQFAWCVLCDPPVQFPVWKAESSVCATSEGNRQKAHENGSIEDPIFLSVWNPQSAD